ncbi:three prime repair exonuclease 2-like isoform X2 [Ambystoma mexicanum]
MSSSIKSFVFIDLETTGLPRDRPKVTEICLLAVHRTSLENPTCDSATGALKLPRMVDKLCLLFDPDKLVTPQAAQMTGLSNGKLAESEKQIFDARTVALIQDFLLRQAQPVCLVAHNGDRFDFPLLKTELQIHSSDLSGPGPVYCLDTMQAMVELDERRGTTPAVRKGAYTLPGLYKRFFNDLPKHSHSAEGDVLAMLLIFLNRAKELLEWADTNCHQWADVLPMYTPRLQES